MRKLISRVGRDWYWYANNKFYHEGIRPWRLLFIWDVYFSYYSWLLLLCWAGGHDDDDDNSCTQCLRCGELLS